MDFIISIVGGILLGTFGLAWSHELVHKFSLFSISSIWKHHLLHHTGKDPEFELRKQEDVIPVYAVKSMLKYFDLRYMTILDYGLIAIGTIYPLIGGSFLVGIFVAENVGYLQHAPDNYPIDFTNSFCNKFGFNCGRHTEHHGYSEVRYTVETNVIFGLLCMYVWLLVCVVLYPFLLLNPAKANYPGVYCFGFIQNVANYRAMHDNGSGFKELLYKMPSIFDKPTILWEYLCLMVNTRPLQKRYSHQISEIRNIYRFHKDVYQGNTPITEYLGTIYDGNHRMRAITGET